MLASTVAFIGMAFTKPSTHRLFHYLTAVITFVAGIAYFSMASDLGKTGIYTEFCNLDRHEPCGTRAIYYGRYIDWAITTPLLLTDLLLTAGVPATEVVITILMDEIMVVAGLLGALTSSSYKWGYWTFGMFAFLYVVYTLVFTGRRYASALGAGPSRVYIMCGVLTIGVWFFYPIAWGLSEGGNVIHPDSEAIFYGILDLIAKPVFGFMLIFGHRNISPAELGLHIRSHDEPLAEKHTGAGHHNGTNTV